MWQANKTGIISLTLGLLILGALYLWLKGQDELLAQQVIAVGFCALLFSIGLCTWLSVRKDLQRCRQAAREEEENDK